MLNQTILAAELTNRVLAAAFAVHRHLGPGMLESTYRECLAHELGRRHMKVEREVPIPIIYEDLRIDGAFRADLVVDSSVLIELKSVERLLPIHEAQTLTYLKLSKLEVAFLLNFNSRRLIHGIRRFLNA